MDHGLLGMALVYEVLHSRSVGCVAMVLSKFHAILIVDLHMKKKVMRGVVLE